MPNNAKLFGTTHLTWRSCLWSIRCIKMSCHEPGLKVLRASAAPFSPGSCLEPGLKFVSGTGKAGHTPECNLCHPKPITHFYKHGMTPTSHGCGHNTRHLDRKPRIFVEDSSFLWTPFQYNCRIPSLLFFVDTRTYIMTPREGLTSFWIFLNFLEFSMPISRKSQDGGHDRS